MINIGFIGVEEKHLPFLKELQELEIFRISLIFVQKINNNLKKFAEENNISLTNKLEDLFLERFKIKLLVDTTEKKEIIHKLVDLKPQHISVIDINILKLLAESIIQKLQLEKRIILSQKYETIGTLVSGICHEINNILMIIMGYAQLANAKAIPEISSYISGIIKSCKRASTLIHQLLSFRNQKELEKRKINIVPLIKETIKFVHETIPENIKIHLEISPNIWNIKADLVNLRHALLNLISNSQEAMPEGGDIYIKLNNVYLDEKFYKEYPFIKPGKYICISVKDTGIGIPKKFLNKIFEPFFTTKDLGRGLGLSYTYRIIKQHDGYILVDSEHGKWTEFRIYLPAIDEKEEEAKENNEFKNRDGTILIVEDEIDLLNMITEFLKKSGYNVLAAINAREAFDIIEKSSEKIDLIITDFILPDSFGSRVSYIAKKKNPAIKTILITGYQTDVYKSPELFDIIIYKPILMAELTDNIYKLLKK